MERCSNDMDQWSRRVRCSGELLVCQLLFSHTDCTSDRGICTLTEKLRHTFSCTFSERRSLNTFWHLRFQVPVLYARCVCCVMHIVAFRPCKELNLFFSSPFARGSLLVAHIRVIGICYHSEPKRPRSAVSSVLLLSRK